MARSTCWIAPAYPAKIPPYKPEYMAKVKAIGDAMYGDASPLDPQYDCKPYGVPRGSLRGAGGYAMQIVQNAQVIAFLYEDRPGPYFRIIYMDGRGHPEDFDPSYVGHSIGHWEGDTLVVDVVGLNDETWLGSGTVGPKLAMMHSDKLHVVERWTRTGNVITYEATVDDPVMFTKPWVMTPRQTQLAAPDDYIRPTMCIPYDKTHLMKHDNTPYDKTAAPSAEISEAATAAPPANMVGNWKVTIHSTIEGILTEQWTVTQDGDKITGDREDQEWRRDTRRFAQRSDFSRRGHGWGQESIRFAAPPWTMILTAPSEWARTNSSCPPNAPSRSS